MTPRREPDRFERALMQDWHGTAALLDDMALIVAQFDAADEAHRWALCGYDEAMVAHMEAISGLPTQRKENNGPLQ